MKADRNPDAGKHDQVGDEERDLEHAPDAGPQRNGTPYHHAPWLRLESRVNGPPQARPQHRVHLEPQVALERQITAVNQAPVDARDSKPRRSFARDDTGYRLAHIDVPEAPRTISYHGSFFLSSLPLSGEITTSSRMRPSSAIGTTSRWAIGRAPVR